MCLLKLPAEILAIILCEATTPSLLQAAYSCRSLFEIAFSSRNVVLSHLERIPGYSRDFDKSDTATAALLLRRRAAFLLYGAEHHADNVVFTLGGDDTGNGNDDVARADVKANSGDTGRFAINTRASAIRVGGDPNVALVPKGSLCVYLYYMSHNSTALQSPEILEPPFEYRGGGGEAIKTVFTGDNMVSVLRSFVPDAEQNKKEDKIDESKNIASSSNEHPFIKEAMRPYRTSSTQLVHYTRQSPKHRFSRVDLCAFPEQEGFRPLALAVASKYLVAISWQNVLDPDYRIVVLHTAAPTSSQSKISCE